MPRLTIRFAVAVLLGSALSFACGGGDGGGPNPVATSISVTPAGPFSLASGATQQLTATVLDQDGAVMPGIAVTWQSTAGSIAAVSASGNVTAALAGPATITARVNAVVSNGVQVTVTPGAASRISAIAGASQSGKVVGSVADTLVARVTDLAGNPISGATVDWQLTAGTGALAASQTVTTAAGTTSNLVTLGTVTGQRMVAATLAGTAAQGQFTIATVAGPAVTLGVVSHAVVVDSGAGSAGLWTAQDAFGNPATLGNVTFTSRNGARAIVSSSGAVSGVQRGSAIIVADLPGIATDSINILVAVPGAPALITDLSSFTAATGSTLVVTILMDMRASGEALGATTVQLDWDPALLTYQSDADAGNGLGATVNSAGAAGGTLLLAAASASGLPGQVALRTVTFQAAASAGLSGALTLSTTEVRAALTFRDLLARTVAGSYPLMTE